MKKETINRIATDGRVVQIFCNQQYKGYHIRGDTYEFTDRFQEEQSEKVYATVAYRFMMLALVNQTYQKRLGKRKRKAQMDVWGLYYNTQKEYLNAEKRRLLDRYSRPFVQELKDDLRKNTFVIDLDEAGIRKSAYLDQSLRDRKDIILLEMGFTVNRVEQLSHHAGDRAYLNRIYTFPAFHMPEKNKYPEEDLWRWFEQMFELLYFDVDYEYMKKREYRKIMTSVGNLSYEWIKKGMIDKKNLGRLNQLQNSIGERTYPLTDFCGKFFDDLIDDLTTQRKIGKCLRCEDFFIWPRDVQVKKRCSLKTDGKNCAKPAADHRRYEKIKAEALERERKT